MNPTPFLVSPTFKSWLSTVLCALGLALSLYLAALKFFALPCMGSGSCHTIINSPYGNVFGIPVSVFSSLIWVAAILTPDRTKRAALLVLLAAGGVVFMTIQFVLLRGFCPYCTAHALTSWAALALHGTAPRRLALTLGAVVAAGGFFATRQQVASHAEARPSLTGGVAAASLAKSPAAFPWLGEISTESPALVLSMNCAACLDLLDELLRENLSAHRTGPSVFFKVTDENRELTTQFVAAVLSQTGPRREAFLTVATVFLSHKDDALSAPAAAAAELGAFFPAAASHREEAIRLLGAQTEALRAARLGDTTPLLVPRIGASKAFFKVGALFPR